MPSIFLDAHHIIAAYEKPKEDDGESVLSLLSRRPGEAIINRGVWSEVIGGTYISITDPDTREGQFNSYLEQKSVAVLREDIENRLVSSDRFRHASEALIRQFGKDKAKPSLPSRVDFQWFATQQSLGKINHAKDIYHAACAYSYYDGNYFFVADHKFAHEVGRARQAGSLKLDIRIRSHL
jgi:hypothetical protein